MPDPRDPPAASAPRRPTADPDLFVIPEAQLPPGFAARLDSPTGAAPPRPASTAALVRDGAGGPEVLLLRRHHRSGFAADAWVFPGGTTDAADRDPALAEWSVGSTPAAWGHRLGVDSAEALGYVAAAVRETLEETGILLGRDAGEAACAERVWDVARRALLNGDATLLDVLREEEVRMATGDLLYLAHWITPEPEPRRYDTRFFLARVPAGARCTPHLDELTEARWVRPGDAVEGFQAGEMRMLPPTVDTLQRLAGYADVREMWGALEGAPVPAILPRMERTADGVAIRIPRAG